MAPTWSWLLLACACWAQEDPGVTDQALLGLAQDSASTPSSPIANGTSSGTGEVTNGTAQAGTTPTGTIPAGTTPAGTTPTGTTPTGTTPTGTTPNNGTTPTGTTPSATRQHSPGPFGNGTTAGVANQTLPTQAAPPASDALNASGNGTARAAPTSATSRATTPAKSQQCKAALNSTSEPGCFVTKPASAEADDWETFKKKHNRTYFKRKQLRVMARMLRGTNATLDHLSDEDRRLMFLGRKASVEDFNKKGNSFKKGINKFADLTAQEVVSRHTGLQVAGRMPRGRKVGSLGRLLGLAPRVDWRERGALTPVKEQGMCGCCWAFAATAALESMTFMATGRLVSLSEQNMIDCDTNNTECRGGSPWTAFDWVQANGGLEEEMRYPYQVAAMKCRQRREEIFRINILGYRQVLESPEDNLMKILAEKGPVVVSVNAGLDSFMAYQSGVYTDPDCGNTLEDLNHAMLAVGYGIDPVDGPYWILRNSWGQDWGEKGYIRVSRKDNVCGVRTLAVYPVYE